MEDSDTRLMEMLAAQAAHREVDSLGADEESIAADEKLADTEKRDILQKSLNMAASNGDVERVRKLFQGAAKNYVDVNMPDEEGTVPLIYASCFVSTHVTITIAWHGWRHLPGSLKFGATADRQNRDIKMLLQHSSTLVPLLINRTVINGAH